VAAVRTPIGRHAGALSSVRPDDLAALVVRAAVERAGVPPAEVEDVVMGCANQAGEDNRNVGRMAVLLAGLPEHVGGTTVNRLCGSGLDAVAQAARTLMLGEGHVAIGAGVESMSRAPWALPKPERGLPTGNTTLYDTTLGWRFINPLMERLGHTDPLGVTAEALAQARFAITPDEEDPEGLAAAYSITREAQDRLALTSHRRALAAADAGRFRDEIIPVPVRAGKTTTAVAEDEGPRRETSLERLASLRPAFMAGGSVTAGNSSPLSDGAAAVLLVSGEYGRAHGLRPLALVRAMATAGVPPRVMGIGPVPATRKALGRAGLTLDQIGLIELNEAFAAQTLAVLDAWRLDADDPRLNPNGGAIALGHPLGASGARILTTLVHELGRRPAVRYGLATMCIGVGQGIAMVIERP
jgi:acetyl-CoA acetyltransferase family protein